METKETLLRDRRALGVVIARMQVPYLTKSHETLIQTCLSRHDRSILFLGVSPSTTAKDPFPYLFRKEMIEKYTVRFTVLPLPDHTDNAIWVDTLDRMVKAQLVQGESAVLYGGRDSFIPYYKEQNGAFECVELAPTDYDSGTESRRLAAIKLPTYSHEAANAILWTLNQIS